MQVSLIDIDLVKDMKDTHPIRSWTQVTKPYDNSNSTKINLYGKDTRISTEQ